MAQQIFVNLPIRDMARSRRFFESLGFEFNPQFTNEQGACMVIGENIHVMLLVESFFQTFTKKPIADARACTEMLLCISRDTRAAVGEIVRRAQAAGAAVLSEPQDHGFMYSHGFEDLDGHIWEVVFLDPTAAPPQA